jgi:hypothetical protein
MLVEAVNWRPSRQLSLEQIMATPESAHYVSGWPKPGDQGVIAEADDQPVGAGSVLGRVRFPSTALTVPAQVRNDILRWPHAGAGGVTPCV